MTADLEVPSWHGTGRRCARCKAVAEVMAEHSGAPVNFDPDALCPDAGDEKHAHDVVLTHQWVGPERQAEHHYQMSGGWCGYGHGAVAVEWEWS